MMFVTQVVTSQVISRIIVFMYWLIPLLVPTLPRLVTTLSGRWRGWWGVVWAWIICPRSESSWPSLSPWWRECASGPQSCWEACSTQRYSTSPPRGPGEFFSFLSRRLRGNNREDSWIWNWHLLLMTSRLWKELCWLKCSKNIFQREEEVFGVGYILKMGNWKFDTWIFFSPLYSELYCFCLLLLKSLFILYLKCIIFFLYSIDLLLAFGHYIV